MKCKMNQNKQNTTVEIDGKPVELTHLEKVYWPEEGITKGDLIAYYREISPVILPYLIDRPQSLNRFPNGIIGEHFFQKDINDAPKWAETIRLKTESKNEELVDYLVCQDEATLIYMINLGCIEINPWSSRVNSLDNPDYAVIELDAHSSTFAMTVQVALVVHQILEEIGAVNRVKTSGQTGLHIFVPLAAKYSYEQARQFAQMISQKVNRQVPELTSLESKPQKYIGKIHLDYPQNAKGKTMVAAYSLRPRPGAPVSTPLDWDELHQPGISPLDFTIKNIRDRLARKGDLFSAVLGPGIELADCLDKLSAGSPI